MKIALSWLAEFVDLPGDLDELTSTLDDLGLVVEGVERVGEGLESVVVARIDEIHPIEGADRIRRVVANAGEGPLEIVCGAMNFEVGNHVPLAPVGAVLPGGFEIAQRKMRGVVSNGMLCSGRELGLSDDHAGLMILDDRAGLRLGQPLLELLEITADVVLDISPEGNRPDAWSVEGVARDLAARWDQPLRTVEVATENSSELSSSFAGASIGDPSLCGSLRVGVIRQLRVSDSPTWVRRRLEMAGMRAVNNIVDASNFVMLELGQPTHPYDAAMVAGRHLGTRRARSGEKLTTLDGVERTLGQSGRGLGDTGVDCVIVDGNDVVIGLAGIMGGSSSEISDSTTDVLLESAFFDPMTIARTVKRLGLRSEASKRFERGVDPTLAARALARFVHILSLSCPELQWYAQPLVVSGDIPELPTLEVTEQHVRGLLGTAIPVTTSATLLRGLGFSVEVDGSTMTVTPSPARLDIRHGAPGRADVIEEIARLYGYRRLDRRTPTWVEPGYLSARQRLRRRLRDAVVALGFNEAWTASLISEEDFVAGAPGATAVRVANPIAIEESILRPSLLVGLTRAWGRNVERGLGDVALVEVGTVFTHPNESVFARVSRGGAGGTEKVELPDESERVLMLLGRSADDARSATATWLALADRLALADVVVRSAPARAGWHPTRSAVIEDRASATVVGWIGELDPAYVAALAPAAREGQRVGLVEIDLDVLADERLVARRPVDVSVPSRFPSASIDLAFVAPDTLNAADLAHALAGADPLVESVCLFDVFRGPSIGEGARSLAYALRLSSSERTLSEAEIAATRETLMSRAASLGAQLR